MQTGKERGNSIKMEINGGGLLKNGRKGGLAAQKSTSAKIKSYTQLYIKP